MAFFQAVIPALRSVVFLMECIILIRVLCELVVVKRDSAPMKFIIRVSEPLLLPVRYFVSRGMRDKKLKFDLSPIVAIIILFIISRLLK